MRQFIADEIFISIQQAQAGLTKIIKQADRKGKIIRIMRNNESLGVLLPNTVWKRFLEMLEDFSQAHQ